jgi:pyrroloquinoline quinone biosynthesis protein B
MHARPLRRLRIPATILLATACAACAAPREREINTRPFAVLLGTAQDGGLPQIGCHDACCEPARRDAARVRLVTSLVVVDPETARSFLIDATPDLPQQVERVRAVGSLPLASGIGGRPPLFDGIFLTHVHFGHYAGLGFLGPEVYAPGEQRLYASHRMIDFLDDHAPNELSIQRGHLWPVEIAPGEPLELAPGLTITAVPVPHREEYSDTYAYRIDGPQRSLLFLPDIDKWDRWEVSLEDEIAAVDFALLDGSFFADGEIPGRSMAEIPHPFIFETLARLAPLPLEERAKVIFVHLNHTNPAADPGSAAARVVRDAGMSVGRELQRFDL